MLSAERLRELLAYDPTTGVWTWRADGTAAGRVTHGYIRIYTGAGDYYAHRLACLYMTGEWPAGLVDHEDENGLNNRWTNLRPANKSKNGANRGRPLNNQSGWKGVSLCGRTGRWRADICVSKKTKNLGRFDCPAAAHLAYAVAASIAFGEFARAA